MDAIASRSGKFRLKWERSHRIGEISNENQKYPNQEFCHRAIKRLSPYKEDLIKLLFNENIDITKLQIIPTESQTKPRLTQLAH